MRTWRRIVLAIALLVVPLAAGAEPRVTINTPGGSPDEFHMVDQGKNGPFGAISVGAVNVTVEGAGESMAITVTIPLDFRINSGRVGERYTVKEDGPCKGLTFRMTERFIKDHEAEHVQQIRTEVAKYIQSVLNNPKKMPGWHLALQRNVTALVQRLLAQEAAEYEYAEREGRFPKQGEFPGLERGARAKSCDEFLKEVGSQLQEAKGWLDHAKQDLEDSQAWAKEATKQAAAARAAAAEAERAARACNIVRFRKATDAYKKAVDAATAAATHATTALESIPEHLADIDALVAAYDAAKTAAGVTAFPAMDALKRQVQRGREDLAKLVDRWGKELATKQQADTTTLQAADTQIKAAYEQLKRCEKAQDASWAEPLRAIDQVLVPSPAPDAPAPAETPGSGGGTPPGGTTPGGTTPPSGPTPDGMRSVLDGLERERAALPTQPPAYAPAPTPAGRLIPRTADIPAPRPRREERTQELPVAQPQHQAVAVSPQEQPLNPCAAAVQPQVTEAPPQEPARQRPRRTPEEVYAEQQARLQATRDTQSRARALTREPNAPALPYVPGSLGESEAANSDAVARLAALRRQQLQQAPAQTLAPALAGPPAPAAPAAGPFVPDQVIVAFNVTAPALVASATADLARQHPVHAVETARLASINTTVTLFALPPGSDVLATVRALAADPRVQLAQPNLIAQTSADHRDAMAGMQYAPRMLNVARTHRLVTGRSVTVAVIDSGVDGHHPDLAGRIAARANFAPGLDGAEVHGTGVAGIIAATADNGVGIYGVAPQASILALRACTPRAPDAPDAACTSWAVTRAVDHAIGRGARVLNLSLAGPEDPLLERLVRSAHSRGIVVVAAAGNQGPAAPAAYPAAWGTVIAVSAVDARADVYPASAAGSFVSVAAPGVEVLTTLPRRAYGALTGTSMAAAHVSGVAALLLQARPDLTPLQIRQALEGTASTAGARTSRLGHGVVDGCRAVGGVLGGRLGC